VQDIDQVQTIGVMQQLEACLVEIEIDILVASYAVYTGCNMCMPIVHYQLLRPLPHEPSSQDWTGWERAAGN
jgi:hypothetical protein